MKIVLLVGIILVVTVLRSFIAMERTRDLLGGRREGVGKVMAAGLGVVTPFCSCSEVPAFLGFVAAGVLLGVTLSFLIASPLVNEVAVVLLYGLVGFRIAARYVASGRLIAIVAGFILGRLRPERLVESFAFATTVRGQSVPTGAAGGLERAGRRWAARMSERSGAGSRRYLLVGLGLGALIHGWVPIDFFVRYAGPDDPLAPLVAVALGAPLYANAAGVLPLIEALHAKGLAMGTLLAFTMSVVALSLPEMILLRRVLRSPPLACFVAVVALAILATGYLFNLILSTPSGERTWSAC